MSDTARASRTRRQRSATESLLSIVLGLEAVLMFFVALAVFRFDVLLPSAAFGGGAAVIVLLLVVGRMLRYRSGIWFGWALQLGLIATGFLLPLMFFIGAGFTAIWIYCFITGVRLDRRNAVLRADAGAGAGSSTESSAVPPPTQSPTLPPTEAEEQK